MRVAFGSRLFEEVTLEWAHGRCAWFALAAAARWGLPLVCFHEVTGRIVHVACSTSRGLFDAYGFGTADDVVAAFRQLGSTTDMALSAVSEAYVRAAFMLEGSEYDNDIADAVCVCETLLSGLGLTCSEIRPPTDSIPVP